VCSLNSFRGDVTTRAAEEIGVLLPFRNKRCNNLGRRGGNGSYGR
jgi:hypothetical protein